MSCHCSPFLIVTGLEPDDGDLRMQGLPGVPAKMKMNLVKKLTVYFEKVIYCRVVAVVCAVSLTVLAAGSGRAATLTSVPMQGGMVMPMVSYHASDGMIHVMMPSTVPQLTPLLVSNPGDSFDPADPWFCALDPSAEGKAFSRRYGFVMDGNTDLLPAGTQIWIRKLSGSAGLSAYRYQEAAPKALHPIFGTDGATNALAWNGMMFHPVFASAPVTNSCSATFEVYLLDTTTGQEVSGSSSGPLAFTWTDVPDGRPSLNIGSRVVVFWPTSTTNWALEGTDALPGGTWTPVTNAPVTLEDQSAVVLDPGETRKFFRMKLAQ